MRRKVWVAVVAGILAVAGCTGGEQGTSAPPGGGGAGGSPTASGPSGSYDPSTASGTVKLFGWQASPEEKEILEALIADFETAFPNLTVDYQTSEQYATAMTANFTAGEPPDLFYVDSAAAPEWIEEDVLLDLEPLAAERGFDTSQFFPGYLDAFRGPEGGIYGFPKDGNTLGMAYNVDMLDAAGIEPPTNWEELQAAAEALTTGDQKAFCLNNGLDRALAFMYQNGGGILNEAKTEGIVDSAENRAALEMYLGWFANEQGARAADFGDDWCGKSLGEERVAIIFEGGWLDPYMASNYADVEYAWAPMPQGTQQATLGFTVSYSIGVDSANQDGAWVLLTYLTGPEGMTTWTEGGVANPSRMDVPAAEGKEILVEGADYARPWSFIPGFSAVSDAFGNAMTAQIEAKSNDPGPVIEATNSALEDALGG